MNSTFLVQAAEQAALPEAELMVCLDDALRSLPPEDSFLGRRSWRNFSLEELCEWVIHEVSDKLCEDWGNLDESTRSDGIAIASILFPLVATALGLPQEGAVLSAIVPILMNREIVKLCA